MRSAAGEPACGHVRAASDSPGESARPRPQGPTARAATRAERGDGTGSLRRCLPGAGAALPSFGRTHQSAPFDDGRSPGQG